MNETQQLRYIIPAVGGLIIALVFTFVGDGVLHVEGQTVQAFIINYFHTITWYLLSAFFWIKAYPQLAIRKYADLIGITAFLVYAVFQLTLNQWLSW